MSFALNTTILLLIQNPDHLIHKIPNSGKHENFFDIPSFKRRIIGSARIPSRKSEFVRGSHDMRRGGTSNCVDFQERIRPSKGNTNYWLRENSFPQIGILTREVARVIVSISRNVYALPKEKQTIGYARIPSRKSEFVRGSHDMRRGGTRTYTPFQRKNKLLVTREFLPANRNSYAGHMTLVEVVRVIVSISKNVYALPKEKQTIGYGRIPSRKSEFLRGSHDMTGGGTRTSTPFQRKNKLLVTGEFLPANRNSYAGHMTLVEVARVIVSISKNVYALPKEIQTIGYARIPSRKSESVRGSHDMRRGGTSNCVDFQERIRPSKGNTNYWLRENSFPQIGILTRVT
ncbi:hypothetical protein V1478_016358 [Vespula squamosa]|uniref:Ribosomal protein L2 n=1 Tax=Vespula squamosa TaxID=30214 RepID=A0ABD1ZZK9_VESSQ